MNNIRRQITVFNNRKVLGLCNIDDQEFLALIDEPNMLATIIKTAELNKVVLK